MMGRVGTWLFQSREAAQRGWMHIGLALLLILPQPAATARIVLSEITSIPENLETRPSEELLGGHHHSTETPRCRLCTYLPVRHSTGNSRASAGAAIATSNDNPRSPFERLRRDQLGSGVRAIC